MERNMRGPAPQRSVTLAVAIAFLCGATGTLTGCGSSSYQDDDGVNCVKLVDPNVDPNTVVNSDDDREVEVVDPQLCNNDEYRRTNGGNGYFFISHGGGYYNGSGGNFGPGTRYIHSMSDGGGRLINSTDTSARQAARIPSTFSNGSKATGRMVSVSRGGLGFGGVGSGGKGAGG